MAVAMVCRNHRNRLMAVPRSDASRVWYEERIEILEANEYNEKGVEEGACIFTVPESLRNERPEAYVPRVVSLGPFHHLKAEFSNCENYKKELIIRKVHRRSRGTRRPFKEMVKELSFVEEKMRRSYGQAIRCDNRVLALMMAQDALFLLDVLRSDLSFERGGSLSSPRTPSIQRVFDPKRKGPLLLAIFADILKMENQIPMFVLKKVHAWQMGYSDENENEASVKFGEMLTTACRLLSPFVFSDNPNSDEICPPMEEKHILEYLYNTIVPPGNNRNYNQIHKTSVDLPKAAELYRRGVKFIPFEGGQLNDIRFERSGSKFFLPTITMDGRTEVFVRNLVALEAFIELETRAVLSYADLMDRLVDTASDVAVLRKCGVFRSHMGSDKEIASAWNGIGRSMWKSGYDPVDTAVKEVTSYYKGKFRVMLGEFMHLHFSKPWRVISIIAACILLALGLVQTVFSILQWKKTQCR